MFQRRDPTTGRNRFYIIAGVCAAVAAVIVIIAIAVLVVKQKNEANLPDPLDRIECPGFNNANDCVAYGCLYEKSKSAAPCFMEKDSFGYSVASTEHTKGGWTAKLANKSANTPYGPSLTDMVFEVTYITENIVRIKLTESKRNRYEVPVQAHFPLLQQTPKVNPEKLAYNVALSNNSDTFNFMVKRSDGTVIWDTSIGGLVLSDQYLQIASYLPSHNIYGLGEHTHPSLRHDMSYQSWPMFARDRGPLGGRINLYGVHPFYTCLENDTKSHGVLFLNSNAMEATLMPYPAISFRTIGGVVDMFFILGDSPEHVVQLYTSLIGRPMLPPRWSLGFQLSRYGYNNIAEVIAVVERTRKAGISQEVQFLDIDHMDGNKDFTFDHKRFQGLTQYMETTRKEYGLRWIIILDPAIAAAKGYQAYESGLLQDVFIKRSPRWKDTMFPVEVRKVNVTFGKVWPEEVVAFPDFFKDSTKVWWTNLIVAHHKIVPFDGLWTDMNEPSNFGTNGDDPFYCQWQEPQKECWSLKCPESPYEYPPYNPLNESQSSRISKMTLCMESVQSDGKQNYLHYDVHSLYGWSESIPTLLGAQKATGTRSLVISRSTYPSSGQHAGHWLGDNQSTWADLRHSIVGMMEFNIFGIPFIGADVCGFGGFNTTEELCLRWMQLGAFYPFYRNHNGMGLKDQDPVAMGDKVLSASKRAIERRYKLLPYLYTLFYSANVDGTTVVRPTFHEFPSDEKTWNDGEQFMWGSCFLITPVLQEGETSVRVYLPKSEWWIFNFTESQRVDAGERIVPSDFSADIPLHVRSGCAIPTEQYQLKTSDESQPSNISLYIFPSEHQAFGKLYVDDGVSIDPINKKAYRLFQFTYKNCSIEFKENTSTLYKGPEPLLQEIYTFKAKSVQEVYVDSVASKQFTLNNSTQVLAITVGKPMKDVQRITWNNKEKKCEMYT